MSESKKIFKRWIFWFPTTVIILSIVLEYLNISINTKQIADIFEIVVPVLVALMAFFALISIYRIEKRLKFCQDLKSVSEKEEKDKDIREQLHKVCLIYILMIFLGLAVIILSKFDINLHSFKIHFDNLLISVLITFLFYVLSSVSSYINPENLK